MVPMSVSPHCHINPQKLGVCLPGIHEITPRDIPPPGVYPLENILKMAITRTPDPIQLRGNFRGVYLQENYLRAPPSCSPMNRLSAR